jgi:Asp-tRNA(Asn)/Glu-tRNA(Gln) amidotransferase A subunit family amidase
MTRTVEDAARLLDVLAGVDPFDSRTEPAGGHIPRTYTAFLQRDGLRGGRIGVFRQAFELGDGADARVRALFDTAVADLHSAGADVVDDVRVPAFEDFPRPPQTTATTKADWERFFAYEGASFPIKRVAELRDAPQGQRVHPLHAARIAEIAAVSLAPQDDPETVQGRKDEQRYRDAFSSAMELARVDALALPVWTFPPVLLGDRGQSPMGGMTFIASALQWPVVVVPIGFVGEQLPIGMQLLGRPWSEGPLIRFAYAYEQATHHRRPPTSVPPLAR